MITLVPLCSMTLMLGKAVTAGNTPAGQRMAAEITSATVSGRLNGGLARAVSTDWFTLTPGAASFFPMCGWPSRQVTAPWYAFRDVRAKRRAVQWLAGNSLIDDDAAAASRFLVGHPDPHLP